MAVELVWTESTVEDGRARHSGRIGGLEIGYVVETAPMDEGVRAWRMGVHCAPLPVDLAEMASGNRPTPQKAKRTVQMIINNYHHWLDTGSLR